jgi:hypothetical protein
VTLETFCIDPNSNTAPLPLIGSSPDGIVCHCIKVADEHRAVRLAAINSPRGATKGHMMRQGLLEQQMPQQGVCKAYIELLKELLEEGGVTEANELHQGDGEASLGSVNQSMPSDEDIVKHAMHPSNRPVTLLPSTKDKISISNNSSSPHDPESGYLCPPCMLLVREVVEIKCHCPFDKQQQRGGRLNTARQEYILSDRGPRCVSAAWATQLQLHMYVSHCWSGLLLSHSATKGMKVWRVYRDEE